MDYDFVSHHSHCWLLFLYYCDCDWYYCCYLTTIVRMFLYLFLDRCYSQGMKFFLLPLEKVYK